jgi:hypothetical protein
VLHLVAVLGPMASLATVEAGVILGSLAFKNSAAISVTLLPGCLLHLAQTTVVPTR